MRRRCAHPGFTLLELIVAMAMASMLALSLYMSLHVAFRARNSAATAMGPMRQASAALDVIRRDLESAVPPTGIMAGAFYADNSGTGSSYIQFFTLGSDADVRRNDSYEQQTRGQSEDLTRVGGIEQVEFTLSTIEDGSTALVRRSTSNLLASISVIPEDEVLARGVRSFRVQFFDGFSWLDYWDSTAFGDTLPAAVEITLELDRLDTENLRAEEAERPYRVVRVFTLPCHTPATDTLGGFGL